MQNRLERLIKVVYKKWKLEHLKIDEQHLDEETLVCFLEGRLQQEENERIKAHLLRCDDCIEAVALNLKVEATEIKEVPRELLDRLKNLVVLKEETSLLEIILRLKEKALEIINTTGDVLVGQELMPAPVLRSRTIKDFKDEVTILKDFKDIRVEVKIENKAGQTFNLIVVVREKQTQKTIKDLRVTLIRDNLELESYLTDSGSVTFEHFSLGKYTVEISSLESKLASILLDIKV